jgi:hypothetical protein
VLSPNPPGFAAIARFRRSAGTRSEFIAPGPVSAAVVLILRIRQGGERAAEAIAAHHGTWVCGEVWSRSLRLCVQEALSKARLLRSSLSSMGNVQSEQLRPRGVGSMSLRDGSVLPAGVLLRFARGPAPGRTALRPQITPRAGTPLGLVGLLYRMSRWDPLGRRHQILLAA